MSGWIHSHRGYDVGFVSRQWRKVGCQSGGKEKRGAKRCCRISGLGARWQGLYGHVASQETGFSLVPFSCVVSNTVCTPHQGARWFLIASYCEICLVASSVFEPTYFTKQVADREVRGTSGEGLHRRKSTCQLALASLLEVVVTELGFKR